MSPLHMYMQLHLVLYTVPFQDMQTCIAIRLQTPVALHSTAACRGHAALGARLPFYAYGQLERELWHDLPSPCLSLQTNNSEQPLQIGLLCINTAILLSIMLLCAHHDVNIASRDCWLLRCRYNRYFFVAAMKGSLD